MAFDYDTTFSLYLYEKDLREGKTHDDFDTWMENLSEEEDDE